MDPDRYAPLFIEAGADQVSVHQETCPHLDRTLRAIQAEGRPAGVVLNPSTPVTMLEDVLEVVDFVLIMSVNPGFGGQRLIPRALEKIRWLKQRRAELGLKYAIEIDGGVNHDNLAEVVQAGCDWVVPAATVAELRQIAEAVRC